MATKHRYDGDPQKPPWRMDELYDDEQLRARLRHGIPDLFEAMLEQFEISRIGPNELQPEARSVSALRESPQHFCVRCSSARDGRIQSIEDVEDPFAESFEAILWRASWGPAKALHLADGCWPPRALR
jgi:hypothetical protein